MSETPRVFCKDCKWVQMFAFRPTICKHGGPTGYDMVTGEPLWHRNPLDNRNLDCPNYKEKKSRKRWGFWL